MVVRLAIYYDPDHLRVNHFFLDALTAAGRSLGVAVVPLVGVDELRSHRLNGVSAVLVRSRSLHERLWLSRRVPLVVNSPKLALLGNDKLAQFLWCQRVGIATLGVQSAHNLVVPWVAKPRFGHGGQGVRLMESQRWQASFGAFIAQEFCVSAGSVRRYYVLGEEVLAIVERVARGDFRANLAFGASVGAVEPSEAERDLAQRVMKLVGPGYYGIDLIESPAGPALLELEDVVGSRSLYQLGFGDPAMAIVHWMYGLVSE